MRGGGEKRGEVGWSCDGEDESKEGGVRSTERDATDGKFREKKRGDAHSRTSSGEIDTPQISEESRSRETMRVGMTERDWERRRITSS